MKPCEKKEELFCYMTDIIQKVWLMTLQEVEMYMVK